jgi:hypothetical protein
MTKQQEPRIPQGVQEIREDASFTLDIAAVQRKAKLLGLLLSP